MSVRRVRFVDPKTNTIVDPAPLTPVQNDAPRMGTNAPSFGALAIHPLLMTPATPLWDARVPIQPYAANLTRTNRNRLAESATYPPTARLELQSPHLRWKIGVLPTTPNISVTVYDVLATVQTILKLEITQEEWARFELVGKQLTVAARNARIQDYDPGKQTDEAFNHPRRIDSLGKFTRFAGLVSAPQRGSGSFDIKFERRG